MTPCPKGCDGRSTGVGTSRRARSWTSSGATDCGLAKLVNTLLDFSRIEACRMRARYEPIDLAAVTADLASVFRSARRTGPGLMFTVGTVLFLDEPVYLDREMWEKVDPEPVVQRAQIHLRGLHLGRGVPCRNADAVG